jgi:hypothetical protein
MKRKYKLYDINTNTLIGNIKLHKPKINDYFIYNECYIMPTNKDKDNNYIYELFKGIKTLYKIKLKTKKVLFIEKSNYNEFKQKLDKEYNYE